MIVVFTLSVTKAYAKNKHLEITSASADDACEILYIYGENFGDDPQVKLEWEGLTVNTFTEDYLEASLPVGMNPEHTV